MPIPIALKRVRSSVSERLRPEAMSFESGMTSPQPLEAYRVMNSRESCCTPGRLSTATRVARSKTSCANSSRSGAIAPTAFRCAPFSSIGALTKGCAARVTSVTICAPIAWRLFLPYCKSVLVMFCASPPASSRSAASSAAIASFRSISWTTSASVIQIASALMSNLERGQHLPGKQFLERELAVAHALLEGEIYEGLERLAVLLHPVRPEIFAEQPLHSLGVGSDPGDRSVRVGDGLEELA